MYDSHNVRAVLPILAKLAVDSAGKNIRYVLQQEYCCSHRLVAASDGVAEERQKGDEWRSSKTDSLITNSEIRKDGDVCLSAGECSSGHGQGVLRMTSF